MEKGTSIQAADAEPEETASMAGEEAGAELPEAENDAEEAAAVEDETAEGDVGGGKIALQSLIAEGVRAVLEEMGLKRAGISQSGGEDKPRFYGATGGANPPPRAEEDEFMKGFREV